MIKFFKANRGFTLIELIVTMAIAIPVMLAIMSAFSLGSGFLKQSNDIYSAQSIANIIGQRIQTELRYADSVNIYADEGGLPSPRSSTSKYIYQKNGSMYLSTGDGTPTVFPVSSEVYACSLMFYGSGSDQTIGIDIKISSGGKQLYETKTSVLVNNISGVANGFDASKKPITKSGSAVEYTITP